MMSKYWRCVTQRMRCVSVQGCRSWAVLGITCSCPRIPRVPTATRQATSITIFNIPATVTTSTATLTQSSVRKISAVITTSSKTRPFSLIQPHTHTPVPRVDDKVSYVGDADWSSQYVSQLGVCITVRCCQGWHIYWVSYWLVARRVDHVA